MEASGGACPKCGAEDAVEFDLVQGVSACMVCGTVLDEEQLVHTAAFDVQGGHGGTFVGAADTGEVAAAYALEGRGAGLAIQRSKSSGSEGKLKARVRELSALLHLQPSAVDQALHVLGQAVPELLGNWRRDLLAGAATYAACRLNSLPLTLADLSAVTQIAPATLGRYYRALCRLLGLHPPLLLAPDLLPRCLDRVTREAVQGGALLAAQVAELRRDAAALLGFMDRELERRRYPMALVGAALVLAGEMNLVMLSLDHVSSTLQLQRSTLTGALGETRTRLLQLAAFLPYSSSINIRNVGSHARAIVRVATLVGSAKASSGSGGEGGGGSSNRLAGAAGQQKQLEQPQQQAQQQAQQQQEMQPGMGRQTAAVAGAMPPTATSQQQQRQQQARQQPQCQEQQQQQPGQGGPGKRLQGGSSQPDECSKRPRLREPCAAGRPTSLAALAAERASEGTPAAAADPG